MQIHFKDGVIAELINFTVEYSDNTRKPTKEGPSCVIRGYDLPSEEDLQIVEQLSESPRKILPPYKCVVTAKWFDSKNEPQVIQMTWRMTEEKYMERTPYQLITERAAVTDARNYESLDYESDCYSIPVGPENEILS